MVFFIFIQIFREHSFLKIDFVFANGADSDEMPFIWVFTVCQSTCLGVIGLQKVKNLFIVIIIIF